MNTKKIYQIFIYLLLIAVIIGFTVPAFFNSDEKKEETKRICQTDADCYLVCNDLPLSVLCSQNLCQVNSCQQKNSYPYNLTPAVIELTTKLEGKELNLSESAKVGDFFVVFKEKKVFLYSSPLYLNQILEKVNVQIENQCLTVNKTKYCSEETATLKLKINNQDSYSFGNYLPQDKDIIEITYP